MRRLLLLLIPTTILMSCSADLESKLGAEGELCQADNDCRIDLICDRGLCLLPGDAEPEGNPEGQPGEDPNPDVQPEPNPEPQPDVQPEPDPVEIEELCKALCERLNECGFDAGGDECVDECTRELRGFEDGAECLLGLGCRDLANGGGEECFEFDGDDNNGDDFEIDRCFEVCDFVTNCDEFIDRCGPRVARDVSEQCFEACFDDATRAQILQAQGFSCEAVVPLAISAFGLDNVCE